MLRTALRRISQVNAGHPWSHNDFYHRWLLRTLPRQLDRTLDVGCGTGNLVRTLTTRSAFAEGIDTDAAIIATARELSAHHPTAQFEVDDLMTRSATTRYDAVTAVAVVHHLPLRDALLTMRALLAPHGTLVVVGCYRSTTIIDRLLDVAAVPANCIVGVLLSARADQARVAMSAPTSPPAETLVEIRTVAADVLPGARVRRGLFWRYLLVYRPVP